MPTFLAELLAQLKGIWARLDGGQRLTMGLVFTATLVGLGAVVWFAGRPDYQVVLSTEDPKVYGEATSVLSQAGIPFREEGHTVLVESARVKEAQGKLFKAGVTTERGNDVDGSLASITLDSSTKEYQLLKAGWANAERSVRQIEGVISVRVTGSKPKKTPFTGFDKMTQPRANAVIEIRPGASFEAIARATVSAVAAAMGVPEEYVTVTDAKTARRFQTDPDSGSSLDMNEFVGLERRRSIELTERAQALLDRMYPNQVQVVVSAQLDPNWSVRNEKILSDKPLVKEDRTDKKDAKEGAGSPAGDPSTGTQSGNGGSTASATKNETRSKTYFDPSIGEKRSGMLAPELRKLTVALSLDSALNPDAQKIEAITKLVKQAVGWDDTRDGQGFAVHVDKFAPVSAELLGGVAAPSLVDRLLQWAPAAGQAIAVVVVLLFMRGLLKKTKVQARDEETVAPLTEQQKENLTPEEQARRMRREIERAIAEDPATISRMLESWLEEQKA